MAELNKKDVQNNKEEVPFAHYEARFRELDPEEAAQRCGVKFENGAFTVTLLGDIRHHMAGVYHFRRQSQSLCTQEYPRADVPASLSSRG